MIDQIMESVVDLFEPHKDKVYDDLPVSVQDVWNTLFDYPGQRTWDGCSPQQRMDLAREQDEVYGTAEYEAWRDNNWGILCDIDECERRLRELEQGPFIDVAAKHKAIDQLREKILVLEKEAAIDFFLQATGESVRKARPEEENSGRVVHSTKERKSHLMHHAITMAIEKAKKSVECNGTLLTTAVIWSALCDLAANEAPPHPLVGVNKDGNIKISGTKKSDGTIKGTYSKRDLANCVPVKAALKAREGRE